MARWEVYGVDEAGERALVATRPKPCPTGLVDPLPPRKRLYRWLSQVFARWAETAEDE